MIFRKIWTALKELFHPRLKVRIVAGDSLPKDMPRRDLVLARDDGEDWCVGMKCPCRCGRTIELLVIPEADPGWRIQIDNKGLPSLSPSVWLKDGCKSHFWVRHGRVEWCD
jgi:hypothetical protein